MMRLLVLLAAVCCVAVAQPASGAKISSIASSLRVLTAAGNRVTPSVSNTPNQVTNGGTSFAANGVNRFETHFVFSTDPAPANVCPNAGGANPVTCFSKLYSTPLSGTSTDQKQLAPANNAAVIAGSTGVLNNWRFDPMGQYVLFQGEMETLGTMSYYSVPVGGGDIEKLSPDNAASSLSAQQQWQGFRPSSDGVYGTTDSFRTGPAFNSSTKVLFTAMTAAGTATVPNPSGDTMELWSNNVYGRALKKVNVDLGAEGNNKEVRLVTYTRDWIIYTANPGTSATSPSTDARLTYITDWEGNQNVAMTPSTTAARVDGTFSAVTCNNFGQNSIYSSTCNTVFSPNRRYIGVWESVESNTYRSLRVFDTNTMALLNGGAAINPPIGTSGSGVTRVYYSRDSTRIFFIARPASVDHEVLYMWKLDSATGTAATAISPAQGTGGTIMIDDEQGFDWDGGFGGQMPIFTNTHVVFRISEETGTGRPALFSFDFTSGTSSADAKKISPAVDATIGTISNIRLLPSALASNVRAVFRATPTTTTTHLYSVAVDQSTASTPVQLSIAGPTAAGSNEQAQRVLADLTDGKAAVAYVVYSQGTTAPPNARTNWYAVPHNAAANTESVRVTPDFDNNNINPANSGYFRQAMNVTSQPAVYYTGTVAGQTTPYFYVANCVTGQVTQLSRGIALPTLGSTIQDIEFSSDKRFVAFTAQTTAIAAQRNEFLIQADGAEEPVRVSTTNDKQSFPGGFFSSDSRFYLTTRTDSDAVNGRYRAYSVNMRLPVANSPQVDITPEYPNFPNGDPVLSAGGAGFLHNNDAIGTIAQLPNAPSNGALNSTSIRAIYTITPVGNPNPGVWVRISANGTVAPETPVLTGNTYSCTLSFRTIWFVDTTPTAVTSSNGGEVRINRSAASTLVPALGLLVLSVVAALM